MSSLPVPLAFELPGPQWEPVSPESLGVENAAFLAVRHGAEGGYTPTISISGDLRPDSATLPDIAEETLQILRTQAEDVELIKRQDTGSAAAPSVGQLIGLTVRGEVGTFDVRQAQVLLALLDKDDPAKRAVVILTCTTTYSQFDSLAPEFQSFVASVRPEAPPGG